VAVSCCNPGTICFELIKGLPAAFIALVIGAIAAIIAYRQYQVAHAKLKLDLFEMRFAIFSRTWEILSETATQGTRVRNYGLGNPFSNFIPEAAFLFGKDVEEYLSMAVKQWTELWGIEAEPNVPRHAERRAELERWFFQEASTGAKKLFGRYLNFDTWK